MTQSDSGTVLFILVFTLDRGGNIIFLKYQSFRIIGHEFPLQQGRDEFTNKVIKHEVHVNG